MRRDLLVAITGAILGAAIALFVESRMGDGIPAANSSRNSRSEDLQWRQHVPTAVLKQDGLFEFNGEAVDARTLFDSDQVQRQKALVIRIGKEVQPHEDNESLRKLKTMANGIVWVFEDVATATGAGFNRTLDLGAIAKK